MYRISYRKGRFLKKLFRISMIVLSVLLAIAIVLLIYLEPFVTYDREGAHLDLSGATEITAPTQPNSSRPVVGTPEIIYVEKTVAEKTIAEQGGYYITTSMLQDPAAVLAAVKELDEPCAVMLEVKSIHGNSYYSTAIDGGATADVEIALVDELIAYLNRNGFYMIAAVPAFRDTNFALSNQSCGLPLSSGALWMDERGCYWLDPANETVLSYLMQIARELSSLGFREVAFSDFTFPTSNNIHYNSELSGDELIRKAVADVSAFFTGSNLTISYITSDLDFPASACSGRLYITNADGSTVERYVQAYGESGGIREVVFQANSRDSRFNEYAVLRPLL